MTQQFDWKIPIKSLELTQILGEPCEFQVKAGAGCGADCAIKKAKTTTILARHRKQLSRARAENAGLLVRMEALKVHTEEKLESCDAAISSAQARAASWEDAAHNQELWECDHCDFEGSLEAVNEHERTSHS